MKIKLVEGRVLMGTARQIVQEMRAQDFDTSGDLLAYAQRVADRAAMMGYTIKLEHTATGAPMADDLSAHLLAELLRVGLAEEVQ
jgi:hypothetical protein